MIQISVWVWMKTTLPIESNVARPLFFIIGQKARRSYTFELSLVPAVWSSAFFDDVAAWPSSTKRWLGNLRVKHKFLGFYWLVKTRLSSIAQISIWRLKSVCLHHTTLQSSGTCVSVSLFSLIICRNINTTSCRYLAKSRKLLLSQCLNCQQISVKIRIPARWIWESEVRAALYIIHTHTCISEYTNMNVSTREFNACFVHAHTVILFDNSRPRIL